MRLETDRGGQTTALPGLAGREAGKSSTGSAVRPSLDGLRADLLALRARLAAIRDAAEVAIAEVDLAIASAAMRTTPAGRTAAAGGTAGSPAPREEWLSIAEAAKEFNLTKKWLYAHLMEFPGARKRGPKLIRIPRSDLERHGLRCRETD